MRECFHDHGSGTSNASHKGLMSRIVFSNAAFERGVSRKVNGSLTVVRDIHVLGTLKGGYSL